MNCSNCKHWAKWRKPKDNVADCNKVTEMIKENDKTFEIEAYADDDSGLETLLMTGANFGCLHFEPKNN